MTAGHCFQALKVDRGLESRLIWEASKPLGRRWEDDGVTSEARALAHADEGQQGAASRGLAGPS